MLKKKKKKKKVNALIENRGAREFAYTFILYRTIPPKLLTNPSYIS